jgi:NAD(P)-dependent dehydrogenase (short-subunit alcohol dehydrogenase family)
VGDLIVVTGGARGVTADAIEPLVRAAQPTVLLLGRSPAPGEEPRWAAPHEDEASLKRAILQNLSNGTPLTPAEVQREYHRIVSNREVAANLQRLEAAGATVIYRAVDVRDPIAIVSAINEARKRSGPVRGVVHGAGVIEDHLIEHKTREAFERVFDTKVRGLAAVLRAVEPDDLRFIALFSSVSGRFGRRGQVDYAMANEVLNKAAQRIATLRPSCRVVSLNWGPWDGGMVGPSLKREFKRLGIELISLEAGGRALLAELSGGGDAVEVVLGAALAPSREPAGSCGRAEVVCARSAAEQNGHDVALDLHVAFERSIDVGSHRFLDSHRIGGHPVLPVAMMMEWLAHGALHDNPGLFLHGLSDLRLLKGVVLGDETQDLRVMISRPQRVNGHYEVAVELRGGPTSHEHLHARGRAILVDRLPDAPSASLRNGHTQPYPRAPRQAYEEVLFHGPDFFAIEEVHGHSPQGIAARVRSSPAPEQWMQAPLRSEWIGDPLAIDAGLQLGLLWSHEYLGGICLPSYAAEYRQYCERFPREGVTARLEVRAHDASRVVGDVVFVDQGGRVVAELQGSEWIISRTLRKTREALQA